MLIIKSKIFQELCIYASLGERKLKIKPFETIFKNESKKKTEVKNILNEFSTYLKVVLVSSSGLSNPRRSEFAIILTIKKIYLKRK